ncbi:MAG: flagellar export chaperone FlgN [Nitrospirota bacterium]|nr:flagellar export chaperone FlgN [Nitrospirota bacterium]
MFNTATTTAAILDILTREAAHCDLLNHTLQQERNALRQLSLAEFPSLNAQRLNDLQGLQALEAEREAVVHRCADAWGLSRTTLSLQAVIDRLAPPDKREVERCHERLTAKVRALRQETAVNELLVAGIQTLCRKAMHLTSEALPKRDTYSASGESQRAGIGGTMLRQRG